MSVEKLIESDRLTSAQEVFIAELVKGTPQRHALLKAYPNKSDWQWNSIDSYASTLLSREKVKKRFNELMAVVRAEEQADAKWTREQSIKTLRGVIKRNTRELDRINSAYESEIEGLLRAIEKNPKRAKRYASELLVKQKSRRITATHNTGIISAVAELNKMQGFNEENINLNGIVIFGGEEELED